MKKQFPLPCIVITGLFLSLIFPQIIIGQNPTGTCDDPISVDAFLSGDTGYFLTSSATTDLYDDECTSPSELKLWFSFTALGPNFNLESDCPSSDCKISLLSFGNNPCDLSNINLLKCNDNGASLDDIEGLIPGENYYLALTVESLDQGVELKFSNPQVNINDQVCDAIVIPSDGTCTLGTTSLATQDFINATTNCAEELFTQSVWYKTSLSPGKTTLDLNLSNLSISGDVAVLVGTLASCEDDSLIIEKAYCGIPADFSVFGLSPGQSYYIGISTTTEDAGDFELCLLERSPPLGCAQNNSCEAGHNGPQAIILNPEYPGTFIQGCNTGASPGKNFGGGASSCFDFNGPTVWYSYQPVRDGLLQLSMSSGDLVSPQMAIFISYDCENFILINCSTQGVLLTSLFQYDEYYIAISDTNDNEGDFTLLAQVIQDGTKCNQYSEISIVNTSKGSPLDGPFLPGETVDVCFSIYQFSTFDNSCQWLHGIVPKFGPGWDPSSFHSDGSPINMLLPLYPIFNSNLATWSWYPEGFVFYNDIQPSYLPPNEPVGPGWFVAGIVNQGSSPCLDPNDPNCSWGDGISCNNYKGQWQVCFQLTTVSNECSVDPSFKDCSISFRTYGDGETGGWPQAGCQADLPWTKTMQVSCCDSPCEDCPTGGLDFSNEWISSVKFGNFTHSSGATSYSDFTDQVIDLQTGPSNNFTLQADYSDLHYNEYWKIWIDFNEDGDFKDDGEEVFSNASLLGTLTGNIEIPANLTGTRKMRIAMSFDSPPKPCSKFGYGEAEDYTVQFDFCEGTVPTKVEYLGDDVKVSWETIPQATRYVFIYRERIIGTWTWTSVTTEDQSILLTELDPGKRYEYHIRTECPNGWTDWSSRYYFMTDPGLCFTPSPSNVTMTGPSTVKVEINTITTTNSYRIRYRPVGSMNWVVASSAVDFFTLLNIEANLLYEYQLAAICSNGLTNYSGIHHFTLEGLLNREFEEATVTTSNFSLSPNPSKGQVSLYFSGLSSNNLIELFSLDGKKIAQYEIENANEKQLDLSHLSAGVYFVRWHNQNDTQTQKLIINK